MRGAALAALAAMLLLPGALADPHVRPGFDYGPEPSPAHVYEVLSQLVQWQRNPFAQGDEARDYLLDRYRAMGLDAEVVPGDMATTAGGLRALCESVVATVPGRDADKRVVIGGHYDSVLATGVPYSTTVEGAYDNGVGTSAVVELARLFHQYHHDALQATMVFANWDCEEGGSRGARPFAENLTEGVEVLLNINLDMIGLNYPVVDALPPAPQPYYNLYVYTAPVEDFRAYPEEVAAFAERFAPMRALTERVVYEELGLPPKFVWVQDDIEGNSDQRAFVERGIPALWLRGMHHGLLFNRDSNTPPDLQKGLDEMNFKHTPADSMATLELFAGGKAELLKGIRTGLDVAYRVALAAAGPQDAALGPTAQEGLEVPWPGGLALLSVAAAAFIARRRTGR